MKAENGQAECSSSNSCYDGLNLENPREELAVVECEIEKVSTTLRTLVHRTHELKVRINELYSSIRILPPEVIAEIFQWCIPPFNAMDEHVIFASTPLFIGSICSSWRKITWSTPIFWTSLTVSFKTSFLETKTKLLEQWLSRSGDLPLSIRLFSDEDIPWGTPSKHGAAVEVMCQHSSRWSHLDLRIPTSWYRFLPRPNESLPLLKTLHLNPPGGQGERRHTVDMTSSAQIHNLSLSCVYLISMKFQWDQVTHLQLEAFYVDECLEAMRQTPQLVSCSLRNIIRGDDGHAYPDTPLLLQSLNTLLIDNEKDTRIAALLEIISAPNLHHFSYSGRYLINCSQICDLVSRSPALQTFSLIRTIIHRDDTLIQLLRALKTVVKFTFIAVSNSLSSPLDDAVLLLCDPSHSGAECLLPALQELEYSGPLRFTWHTLLQVLERRQPSKLFCGPGTAPSASASTLDKPAQHRTVAELQSVYISLNQPSDDPGPSSTHLEESVISRLTLLDTNGLKVVVTTTLPTHTPPDSEEYS